MVLTEDWRVSRTCKTRRKYREESQSTVFARRFEKNGTYNRVGSTLVNADVAEWENKGASGSIRVGRRRGRTTKQGGEKDSLGGRSSGPGCAERTQGARSSVWGVRQDAQSSKCNKLHHRDLRIGVRVSRDGGGREKVVCRRTDGVRLARVEGGGGVDGLGRREGGADGGDGGGELEGDLRGARKGEYRQLLCLW